MANAEDNVDIWVTGGVYTLLFATPIQLPGMTQPAASAGVTLVGEQLPWIQVSYMVGQAKFFVGINTIHLRAVTRQR